MSSLEEDEGAEEVSEGLGAFRVGEDYLLDLGFLAGVPSR